MRVVLDVNILVSAALTPTPGHQARDILDWAEDQYTLLLSDFILWKLETVLRYDRIQKKYPHLTEDAIQTYLAQVKKTAEVVVERTQIDEVEGSRDPEDNYILATAVDGQAVYLVTRNTTHFPSAFRSVSIIAPADFLRRLREQKEPDQPDDTPPRRLP